jgi:hypothetical protein
MSDRTRGGESIPAGLRERSVVWRAIRWPLRRLAAFWRSLDALDGTPWPPPANSVAQLERIVADSRIARPATSLTSLIARAAATSRTLAWGRGLMTEAERLPIDIVVRLAGVALLTALAAHAVFLVFMPPRLRPALPWTLGALLFLFAVVMMAASGSVARAWMKWKAR